MKKIMSLLLSVIFIMSLVPMTVGATAAEDWNSFIYYQDGPVFSVEATEFTGTGSYLFIAAAYDSRNNLVDVVSSNAQISNGTLTAEVDFEAGENEEADVSIAKVTTMLWDSFTSVRPVAESGSFSVTPQTYDSSAGTYSSLTNGFYEAAGTYGDAYRTTWKYLSTDESGKEVITTALQGEDTWSLNRWDINQNLTDNNLSTNCVQAGADNARLVSSQLSSATAVDRVVIYSYEDRTTPRQKGTEYYLTTERPKPLNDDADAESTVNAFWSSLKEDTATSDVYYLGTSESMAKAATDADAKLVYDVDTDNAYQYIVAKKSALNGVGGYTQEMQAYKKVTNEIVIDELTISAKWDSLTYTQNGPAFTVNAAGFSTNADELNLVATAYNSAGTEVAKVSKPLNISTADSTATATVDFEEEVNEADVSITSVKTALQGIEGSEATFTVTAATCTEGTDAYVMTNGFYEQVAPKDTNNSSFYLKVAASDSTTIDINEWSRWSKNKNLYDGDLSTFTGAGNNRTITGFIVADLGEAKHIDRVVAYTYGQSALGSSLDDGLQFYASNLNMNNFDKAFTTTEELQAAFNKFAKNANSAEVQHVGTLDNTVTWGSATAATGRTVFDLETNHSYRFMMARLVAGDVGGYVRELQAFTKVTATRTVPSNK